MVVQTKWIEEVLRKQCAVKAVPLNHHLLIPHFMAGLGLDTKVQQVERNGLGLDTKVPKQVQRKDNAASTYTQYNSVWNKLEQDCSDSQPEGKFNRRLRLWLGNW